MRPVKRVSAWIPTLAGLSLLVLASRTGVLPVVLAALPASLMLAGGVISLLAPDLRAPQHIATGAVLGLVLALPLSLVGGLELGLVTLASSGAAFVAAGWLMIRLEPPLDEVPAPAPSFGYGARVALDTRRCARFHPQDRPAGRRRRPHPGLLPETRRCRGAVFVTAGSSAPDRPRDVSRRPAPVRRVAGGGGVRR